VIAEVALVPSLNVSGVFEVTCDGHNLWSRKTEGKFPEAKDIKQRVRDLLAPAKGLGHSDKGSVRSRQEETEAAPPDDVEQHQKKQKIEQ
ncbi:unnamed protein product, partial [Polarella glacialis]